MNTSLSGFLTEKDSKPGLGIASFVLAMFSLFTSPFIIGGFLALISLVLGVIHLKRENIFLGMTKWGVGISALGLLVSIIFSIGYFNLYREHVYPMQDELLSVFFESEDQNRYSKLVGQKVPNLTFETIGGEEISLQELRGKRVVLDFWATWCPPCRKEIPHFIKLAEEFKDDGLVIIGVSNEDEETLKRFSEIAEFNYHIVAAEILPEPFDGVDAIPTTFIINRQGEFEAVLEGYHDYEDLREAVTDSYGEQG